MDIQINNIKITPGNFGNDCQDNTEIFNMCDECDYLICCTDLNWKYECKSCNDPNCPRNSKQSS